MNPGLGYDEEALRSAYSAFGIRPGDIAYVTGNLGELGFHKAKSKAAVLESHNSALRATVGDSGTLAVPTHSFSLCNTSIPFDPAQTPSETGPLTEFIRRQEGSVRQFHPFSSVTAVGPQAAALCGDCTRHVYGPNTPFERLIEANAWCVSLGLPPNRTSSIVHHLELTMAVPYRYTKEIMHLVWRDGQLGKEPFYLFVLYRDADIERDRNVKIFEHPRLRDTIKEARIGMGTVWAYRMQDFAAAARELMSRDIYTWLRTPPTMRPYQK